MNNKVRTLLFSSFIVLILAACSRSAGGNTAENALPTVTSAVVSSTSLIAPSPTKTLPAVPSVTVAPTVVVTPTITEVPLPSLEWSVETVDSGKQGLYPCLAISPEDVPYIAYLDDVEDDLKIASFENGRWWIQAFESPWADGFFPSIVFDNQGRPQVTRWILSMRRLAYMPWTKKDGWVVTTSLTKVRVASNALALDRVGTQVPHIVYFDLDANGVKYVLYRPSGWVVQSVDQTTAEGVTFPLALDSLDRPYVAYYKDQVGLVLAIQDEDGKTWQTQVVDEGVGVGLFPSLVMDAEDNPHLSYIDTNQGMLKYARLVDGEWNIQVADGSGDASGPTSIALSQQGDVHISYYDKADYALMHALRVGGRWQLIVVDNEGDAGLYNSLALDSNGDPHIAYYVRQGRSLKYASIR